MAEELTTDDAALLVLCLRKPVAFSVLHRYPHEHALSRLGPEGRGWVDLTGTGGHGRYMVLTPKGREVALAALGAAILPHLPKE